VYDTSRAAAAGRLAGLPLLPGTSFMPGDGRTAASKHVTDAILADAINAPPKLPLLALGRAEESGVSGGGSGSSGRGWGVAAAVNGSRWALPKSKPVNPFYGLATSAGPLMDVNKAGALVLARDATLEAHE
jgi:hypothetical protein